MSTDAIRFFAATDVGNVREHNEDNFLVDKKLSLFMVADGMGGHAAGEVASAIAVRAVHEEIKREKELLQDFLAGARGAARVTNKEVLALMEHAVQRACSRIHEEAQADAEKRGMGTTLSVLLILGTRGFIAHVGDSRIYMQREGVVQQVTEDHTVFNELVKRGKLSREQIEKVAHKNAITRAVGVYERVDVDTLMIEVLPGDQFVLASDGLTGYLDTAEELAGFLAHDGDSATKGLVGLAKDRGGKDNITVVLVRLGSDGQDEDRARRLAQKREVLARMPLFARLNDRELLRVMQSFEARVYEDAQTVIREGDRGDELFIVLSGKVSVSRGGETLTRLGAGEHFGEMALIRAVPRSATVNADGQAELIVIRRQDFFELLRSEHEIAVKMLWQFLGVLADRLDQTSSELRHAKQELHAEEITDDVAIEIFPGIEGDRASGSFRSRS
jgi:serine/threonine protein phosphatase PrpC/CRP-like cAMP-binding protein